MQVDSNPLIEIERTLQAVLERHGSSIVGLGRGWGTGSGLVIADGLVLACAHSLRDGAVDVVFADGGHREGRLGGSDSDLDLAVVEVDTAGATPLPWSERAPRPGQAVIALANPGGRGVRV